MESARFRFGFIVVAVSAALALLFFLLQPFVAPLALAVVFAVLLNPLYEAVRTWVRYESLAASLTVLASFVCVVAPLGLLGYYAFEQLQGAYHSIVQQGTGVQDIIAALLAPVESLLPEGFLETVAANTDSYVRQGIVFLGGQLGSALSGAANFFIELLVFVFAFFYLLIDGPALRRRVSKLTPLSEKDDEFVFNRLSDTVHSVIVGSLVIALIQGVVASAGFWFFGVPNPVLWGAVTAFAALIPSVGTSIIIIPAVLYLGLTGDLLSAAGLGAWGTAAVGLVDNFLAPRLIGRGAKLHPLLIMLSVLGGLALFGASGIVLGPLAAGLALALLSLYEHSLSEREPVR